MVDSNDDYEICVFEFAESPRKNQRIKSVEMTWKTKKGEKRRRFLSNIEIKSIKDKQIGVLFNAKESDNESVMFEIEYYPQEDLFK